MSTNFLFSSIEAAREVTYILQGEWDECNGVEFVDHDIDALKLAAELCNAEYCEVGNDCKFVLMSDFSATDIEAIAVQMANSYNHEVEYGSKGFWQSVVKVAQDVMEVDQLTRSME